MAEDSIVIASDAKRKNVLAEICSNGEEWAEISQEGEEPIITFFPPFYAKYWGFPLDEALKAIEDAKKKATWLIWMNEDFLLSFFFSFISFKFAGRKCPFI